MDDHYEKVNPPLRDVQLEWLREVGDAESLLAKAEARLHRVSRSVARFRGLLRSPSSEILDKALLAMELSEDVLRLHRDQARSRYLRALRTAL